MLNLKVSITKKHITKKSRNSKLKEKYYINEKTHLATESAPKSNLMTYDFQNSLYSKLSYPFFLRNILT